MIKKPNVIEKWQKRNKYGRPGTPLSATKIAIHYTGKPDVDGDKTVSYFNNVVANGYKIGNRYIFASSHYVIGLGGEIYQLIPTDEICYATNSANSYAIAIEVQQQAATTTTQMRHTKAWSTFVRGFAAIKILIVKKTSSLTQTSSAKNTNSALFIWSKIQTRCNNLRLIVII